MPLDAARVPQVTVQELVVRPSTEDDVDPLRAIFFGVYGESYPYPPTTDTLCPAKGYFLTAMVGEKVIGCAGGVRDDPNYNWTEWGRLVVDPGHQGRGHGKRLNLSRKRLLAPGEVALSKTVCNNIRNQSILAKLGFKAMGIMPGRYPGIVYQRLSGQAESTMLNFFWQDQTYGNFGSRRLFMPEDWMVPLGFLVPEERLHAARHAHNGITPQRVHEHDIIIDSVRGTSGTEIIDVVVNHPSALQLIAELRAKGYQFCGFMPGIEDSEGRADRVRLYRLPQDVELDWDLIQVCAQSQQLKEWMRRQCR